MLTGVSAVIFDGDGALFDSKEVHLKIIAKRVEVFGERCVDFRGGDTRKDLLSAGFSKEEVQKHQEIFDGLEDQFGFKIFAPVNGALERLRQNGIMTAAFSNRKFRLHNFEMIEKSGLDSARLDFFMLYDSNPIKSFCDYVFSARVRSHARRYVRTRYPKPDPRAIRPVRERLEILPGFPSSVIYVGDNILDYEFARNCGFGFIGTLCGSIEDPEVWHKAGITDIVKDIGGIPDLILNPA